MAHWENLNMPGFEDLKRRTATVILPVGALEEHGPHLPLGTDTFHALEVARRLAQRRPVVIAPPLFYGLCRSTREHPGTVSLRGETLKALALDLGREFYRQGLRCQLFLSGHAGGTHMAALLDAGETLLAELPQVEVAVVNLLDLLREVLAQKPGLVKTKGDGHAGEVETALMLAAYPPPGPGLGPGGVALLPQVRVGPGQEALLARGGLGRSRRRQRRPGRRDPGGGGPPSGGGHSGPGRRGRGQPTLKPNPPGRPGKETPSGPAGRPRPRGRRRPPQFRSPCD